jgi:hypothetical protein
MLTRDERNVRERLEAWELRIQRILAMYDGNGRVPEAARYEVESLCGALKLSLGAAFKAGDCWEGLSQMNRAERRFYHPAIRAASAHLLARAESRPDAWYQSLCDALSAISDAVVLLDQREGKGTRREWSA